LSGWYLKITDAAHLFAASVLKAGDVAVDATAGNGQDTLFLARHVGPEGRIYAFDLQSGSLERTAALLTRENIRDRVRLIHAGHELMADFIYEPVSVVMFNLGYLPGGDHSVVTTKRTTIAALQTALGLLRPGGLVTVTAYSGHPEGKEEMEALLCFCRELSGCDYRVLCTNYLNRVHDPPALIVICKR